MIFTDVVLFKLASDSQLAKVGAVEMDIGGKREHELLFPTLTKRILPEGCFS